MTDNLDRLSWIMSLISLASNQLRTYSTLTMSAVRLLASECGIQVEIRLDLSSSERGNGPQFAFRARTALGRLQFCHD